MTSNPLCHRHHTSCVRYHRWHMYAFICIIHDIIFTLYHNNPYYLWHHMHYILYITCIIYDISPTLYDVIFTMCVISHNDSMTSNTIWLRHIHFIWHHAQCYDNTAIVCLHSLYSWHYTQCIFDITHNVPMLWLEVYVCHHSLYCMTPYALHIISHPLFMTSHHFIYDFISSISNITSTLSDHTYTVYL